MPNEKPKGQINFNTVLLILLTAIISFGVQKADKALTELVELRIEHNDLARRVGNVESVLGIFVPPVKKP